MNSTLESFVVELSKAPEMPLVFWAEGQRIKAKYHVTEVKLSRVRGLDCGRAVSEWDETIVQLLDGPLKTPENGSYMTAKKFSEIARAALSTLADSAQGELYFEFAPNNVAARKLVIHTLKQTPLGWQVELGAVSAVCKPALRQIENSPDAGSDSCSPRPGQSTVGTTCCTPVADSSPCCAP